jgi:hypothetical protein
MWAKCIGPGLSLSQRPWLFNSRGHKTLKQIWEGIAINVKRAAIPDTSLRKIKIAYLRGSGGNASPDQLLPTHAQRQITTPPDDRSQLERTYNVSELRSVACA